MKTVSLFFPLRTDISNSMIISFKDLFNNYKKSLNVNYIDSNNTISNVVKVSGDLLTTIEICDNIYKRFNNNCVVFTKQPDDELATTFTDHFKSNIDSPIDIICKSTIYTNNSIGSSIHIVIDYDWICDYDDRNPIDIVNIIFISIIRYFNIKSDSELSSTKKYIVKKTRTGKTIETTDKLLAITISNTYPSSVVIDKESGNVIHESINSKVVISGKVYKDNTKPFQKPTIGNKVKATSDQNRFK